MYYFLEMNNEIAKSRIFPEAVYSKIGVSSLALMKKLLKEKRVKMKQTFKKPSYYLLSQAIDGDERSD